MNGCGQPGCGDRHRSGALRPGWESHPVDGMKIKRCPDCCDRGEAEPEPVYSPPQRPRQVLHETTPPEAAVCAHGLCGKPRGRGHPPTGWVRLWVTGPDAAAVWYCSVPCAVVALTPMVRLPLPTVEREWATHLSPRVALDLLVAASGMPMTPVNLTGWRVRQAYDIAVARLDRSQPGWLAHRARLAAARGRLLVEVDEPKPSEIDDDLPDDDDADFGEPIAS